MRRQKSAWLQAAHCIFYIANSDTGSTKQVRFYVKTSDIEVTPQGDAIIAGYIKAITPDYAYPINFSVYGKQNAEIDFSDNGPADMQKADMNQPLHVALSKFDLTNNVYTSHANFLLDNAINSGARSIVLTFRSDSKFSEQYDALMKSMLRGFIQQAHDSKEPQFHEVQAQFKNYTPDQLYAIIYPSLFSFHALGNVVGAAEASFAGTPDMTTGDITVKTFELSATPYGITASGAAKVANKMPQTGNISLACSNCVTMIDDMTAYMGRLQKTVSYFSPEMATSLAIAPGEADALKKFLTVLAMPAKDVNDQNTLRYDLVGDIKSGITINGKQIGEVIGMANQYPDAYMKHPQVPAGTQAAPPVPQPH